MSGVPARAWLIGEKRPLPFGMPKEACWSLPASSWNELRSSVLDLSVVFINFMIVFALSGES